MPSMWIKVKDGCRIDHRYGEFGWRPCAEEGYHEHFEQINSSCKNCTDLEEQLAIYKDLFRNVENALAGTSNELFLREMGK